jgi:hypothetical protein
MMDDNSRKIEDLKAEIRELDTLEDALADKLSPVRHRLDAIRHEIALTHEIDRKGGVTAFRGKAWTVGSTDLVAVRQVGKDPHTGKINQEFDYAFSAVTTIVPDPAACLRRSQLFDEQIRFLEKHKEDHKELRRLRRELHDAKDALQARERMLRSNRSKV